MDETGYNRGMVYRDMGAGDRGLGSGRVGLEPQEAERARRGNQKETRQKEHTFLMPTAPDDLNFPPLSPPTSFALILYL